MITRDGYPHGVPCWIDLDADDPDRTVAFYAAVFGWSFDRRGTTEEPYHVASLPGGDVAGVGATAGSHRPTVWNTYVAVDDIDAVVARAEADGGHLATDVHDLADLARVAEIVDPTGARLRLWQDATHRGAALVNVPGTWNTSDLRTPDPDVATSYYGRLLGWVADEVGYGDWTATMLRVPGYGDVLEAIDPGIRQRHEADGAPPGFTDAIGWLEATPADGDVPAHWQVTFTVDDPDDIARRVEAAGGQVLVPPFDAPPVRSTVVADPSGATFAASAYRP